MFRHQFPGGDRHQPLEAPRSLVQDRPPNPSGGLGPGAWERAAGRNGLPARGGRPPRLLRGPGPQGQCLWAPRRPLTATTDDRSSQGVALKGRGGGLLAWRRPSQDSRDPQSPRVAPQCQARHRLRAFPGRPADRAAPDQGREAQAWGLESFIDRRQVSLRAPCRLQGRRAAAGGDGPRTRSRTSSCGPPCPTSPRCSSSSRPRPAGRAPAGGTGLRPAPRLHGPHVRPQAGPRLSLPPLAGHLPSRCPPS